MACDGKIKNPNTHLTLEAYSQFKESSYTLESRSIRKSLMAMVEADKDSMTADYRARSYYLRDGAFLWFDRSGFDHRAQFVLDYINKVDELGFSKRQFRCAQIKADLERFRSLDFDDVNTINKVAARLEYNLTKAFFRYAIGQRFGFVNPKYLLNRLDVLESDSVNTTYRGLFDIPVERFGKRAYQMMIDKIRHDSVDHYLAEIQPRGPLYMQLKEELSRFSAGSPAYNRVLCNMERCRWRQPDYPSLHHKYVLVNLPSFHLQAVDGEKVLSMRIGCGSFETKTPLLISRIKRMDVNPQWVLPRSIIKNDVLKHVGNAAYFRSRNFFVRERKTGKVIAPEHITSEMLTGKDYVLAQKGGEGNSLGRIIFRFNNNFSVFLHDTSSRGVFSQQDRDVSHGCIRVEKPFDLAVFMMEEKDEALIDKLSYSMAAREIERNPALPEEVQDTLQTDKLVRSINVSPEIPLFITYFTLYPNEGGVLREYPDIYGYDQVIGRHLRNYR